MTKMTLLKPVFISLVILSCQLAILQNSILAQNTKAITTSSALSAANFDFWRNYIRTSDNELDWQNLPWKLSFHEGLKEGAKLNKPILLWAMNGHPLGCT
ncbi:MAG: hypothetical protein GY748_20055 [Planctomycetaceae bacterium]|nr:hypothetical protein [Planctomycetaceae bacterium]